MLKAIHAQEDRDAAEAKAREVTEKLRGMPYVPAKFETVIADNLVK
jgi:hypothetical protein